MSVQLTAAGAVQRVLAGGQRKHGGAGPGCHCAVHGQCHSSVELARHADRLGALQQARHDLPGPGRVLQVGVLALRYRGEASKKREVCGRRGSR